jgi:antitoxin (DNA-binding transcriptional repressor) of toxin-antitoxin stability system
LFFIEMELAAAAGNAPALPVSETGVQTSTLNGKNGRSGRGLTVTPSWCLFWGMTSITSKELHEKTGALLDRVKQGQRFRVMRGGEADALLVPANERIDPPWDEIMADVRKARARGKAPRPNPILAERKKRNYAARVRR